MSDDGATGSALRDVVLALADDPGWRDSVTEQVTDAVLRDFPELSGDEALGVAMRASTADAVRTLVDMLRRSQPPEEAKPPPDAVDYVRELVRRNIGIDVVLRGYHAAEAAFFAEIVARV